MPSVSAPVNDAHIDQSAFEAADAALRSQLMPQARHYLARALALRDLGFRPAAGNDLSRAFRLGSSDPAVIEAVLALHDDPGLRMAAARAALTDSHVSGAAVDRAADTLVGGGVDPVVYGHWSGSTLSGWVASRGAVRPRLWALAADGVRTSVSTEDMPSLDGAQGTTRWRFHAELGSGKSGTLRAVSSMGAAATLAMLKLATPPRPRRRPPIVQPVPTDPGVTIVVPVYGDPGSLSDCLASVERQDGPDVFVVVVDDASPNLEVSRLALAFCQGRRRLYLRNATNLGFAASVNAALSRSRRTDVLLLNSDVVLPDKALERLRAASHHGPDIGIVAPLSNDAGNASFPDPLAPRPPLPSVDAHRLDGAADRVNRQVEIDLPSVHGSCILVRRDCFDRIGPISSAYGRGYYEDIDLCLRARECGFRVVAASDVYVTHQSGRSFGPDRYPLIARNMAVLERRFPDHAAEDAAHDAADPLRRVRASIEEALPMLQGPAVLLVGRTATRGALLQERIRQARRDAATALTLDWWTGQDGTLCRLVSDDDRGPRSLAFPLDDSGLERLESYLRHLKIERIELCEAGAMPALLFECLSAADLVALTIVVDGVSAVTAVRQADVRYRLGNSAACLATVALDAMARARAAAPLASPATRTSSLERVSSWTDRETVATGSARSHDLRDAPAPLMAESRRQIGMSAGLQIKFRDHATPFRLGVLLPQPCFDADRLILAMARRLHREPAARMLVLGASAIATRLTAPGTCWVSGSMDVAEIPDALRHHGIDRLWLPYRDSHHWVLEAVRHHGHPAAFYDWSASPWPVGAGDLALDPAESEATSCSRLITWLDEPTDRDGA